jgi:transcriptional regulator with XRE-family HTH domain
LEVFVLAIELIRRERGWSQAQLALLTQLTQPGLSLIEKGRLIPRPDQLERLARALGVPADELLRPVVVATAEHEQAAL